MSRFLSYGRQNIDDADIAAVRDVLRSDYLTTGPATASFENKLAQSIDSPYVTACSSGAAALHLASLALDLGPGDAVIVPSMTFVATANAVRYTGAEVVFADVDARTGLMEIPHLEEALARVPKDKTARALSVVHLRGATPQMAVIKDFCKRHGLFIIEDACHAIGGTYGPEKHKIGSCAYSDMACFSFHPVKTIAMGEGGAVATRNAQWEERLKSFVSHGLTRKAESFLDHAAAFDEATGEPNAWYYEQHFLGYNYRASDIHCALGQSQLARLESFSDKRRHLVDLYRALFTKQGLSSMLINDHGFADPVYHLFTVHIDFRALGKTRHQVMGELKNKGIGTQVHYIPVHRQPYYQKLYGPLELPGAKAYYNTCLSLPLHTLMNDQDVNDVVQSVAEVTA